MVSATLNTKLRGAMERMNIIWSISTVRMMNWCRGCLLYTSCPPGQVRIQQFYNIADSLVGTLLSMVFYRTSIYRQAEEKTTL